MTRSPGLQPLTPSPSALISPANSVPARAGLAGAADGRSWAPRISSPRFVPAARTATTTWPGPAVGAGASRRSNTAPSGPGTANHAFIVWLMTSPSLQLQVLVRRDGEPVGPGPDRRLLEPFFAHALGVGLRNDPGSAGGRRRVERHEVGPRLLEPEPHALRVDDLDCRHARLQRRGARALV